LESVGFSFEAKVWKDHWVQQYESLQAFRNRHPDRSPLCEEKYPKGNALGVWCGIQKTKEARGALTSERRRLLTTLGFNWSLKLNDWETRYEEFATW
jgi:hypothetical protein